MFSASTGVRCRVLGSLPCSAIKASCSSTKRSIKSGVEGRVHMRISEDLVVTAESGEEVSLRDLLIARVEASGSSVPETDAVATKLATNLLMLKTELWRYRHPEG